MSHSYYSLIGFKTSQFIVTRGPGDLIPRSSTMASPYETPILPRLETMLGAISKTIIENNDIDLSPCEDFSVPDMKWECIVSQVFAEYLGATRIYGPFLIVGGSRTGGEVKAYVNVGLGLLRVSNECIEKYISLAEKIWEAIREVNVKRKYSLSREYENLRKELEEECIITPYTFSATGISLESASKTVIHGLIYSYVLRDFTALTGGESYRIALVVERSGGKPLDPIITYMGPRGRPAKLVEEEPPSNLIKLVRSIRRQLAITLLPQPLVKDRGVVLVHPLRPKPLVLQLAKSTLVNGRWAKTSLEPAYQPGVVAVKGLIDSRIIRCHCGCSLVLEYTI